MVSTERFFVMRWRSKVSGTSNLDSPALSVNSHRETESVGTINQINVNSLHSIVALPDYLSPSRDDKRFDPVGDS